MAEGEQKSRLEQIIVDMKAFHIMLDGAFYDWDGTYDVLLVDTGKYLYESKTLPNFRPFCFKLRSKEEGENRCHTCDVAFAKRVAKYPQDKSRQIYYCHVGLIDIAIPIIVDGEHIATVFCGSVRSTNEKLDEKHFKHVRRIERELSFEKGELETLAHLTPQVSLDRLDEVRERVAHLVDYVSNLGHERLQLKETLEKRKQESTEKRSRDITRSAIRVVLDQAARVLTEVAADWDRFWDEVAGILAIMSSAIGASCSMVLVPNIPDFAKSRLVVTAVTGLPFEVFKSVSYPFYRPVLGRVLLDKDKQWELEPFENLTDPETISGSIRNYDPQLSSQIKDTLLVQIRPNNAPDQLKGLLLFFFGEKFKKSQLAGDITASMIQLSVLIGTGYQNSSMYQAKVRDLQMRRAWLTQISHQLIAPLHGVQGYADNMRERIRKLELEKPESFEGWEPEDLRKWQSSIDSIVWASHYVARLAHNLAWVAYMEEGEQEIFGLGKRDLSFELIGDVGGMLITCARDFQGLAKKRKLRILGVNTDSVEPLNGRLCINEDLFRHAVGNLLDNAVKYANVGTDIWVDGGIENDGGIIRVTDVGLRLQLGEEEKIFRNGYRTEEARNRYVTGTGIGLYVTQQIVQIHGGTLTATPSKRTHQGWQTTFTICLPLHLDCGTQGVFKSG